MQTLDELGSHWRRRVNRLKELISQGQPVDAVWITIPWAGVVEMAGSLGVNAVVIDMEHTSIGLSTVEDMIRAADASGVTALVRPARVSQDLVGRILDAGAYGVVFPRIESGEDAISARLSLRHGPDGTRGWGGNHTRSMMWQGESAVSGFVPTDGTYSTEYVTKIIDDLLSVFLIESVKAVESIEEILDRGRPDLVDFGRGDFSAEVGFDNHACDEAFERVLSACRDRGIGMNIPLASADRWYPGCYSMIGADSLLLGHALDSAHRQLASEFQRRSAAT